MRDNEKVLKDEGLPCFNDKGVDTKGVKRRVQPSSGEEQSVCESPKEWVWGLWNPQGPPYSIEGVSPPWICLRFKSRSRAKDHEFLTFS